MIPFPYADENELPGSHFVLISLIAINAAALRFTDQGLVESFGFIPSHHGAYQWLTSLFLHGDIMHLLGNMWFFWVFGQNIEAVMGLWFLPFYLASGVAANGLHMALNPHSGIPCIGASGAISGVLGAYMVYFPRARIKCYSYFSVLGKIDSITYSISAFIFGLLYVLWQYIALKLEPGAGIAYGAHLGGFLMGAAAAVVFPRPPPEQSPVLSGPSGSAPNRGEYSVQAQAIEEALGGPDEVAPVRAFIEAARREPYLVLSERPQLEMARRLADFGYPHIAKSAILKFFLRYPRSESVPEAQLLLAGLEQSVFKDLPEAKKWHQRALRHPKLKTETQSQAQAALVEIERVLIQKFVEPPTEGERFSVFMESVSPPGAAQVSRIAAIMEWTPEQTRELASRAPGLILWNAPLSIAARRSQELEAAGFPVVVLPEDRVIALPSAQECAVPRADPNYLTLSDQIPWKECLLIAAVGLYESVQTKEEMGILDVEVLDRNYQGESQRTFTASRKLKPLIEIVTLNPLARRRWSPAQDGDYFGVLQELILNSINVPVNSGAERAFDRRLPAQCLFNDETALGGYLWWQMQLAVLKKAGFFRPR